MATSVTNMKELCEYVSNKRNSSKEEYTSKLQIYDECKGMGNRRYTIPQKSSFPKQYKAAYNKIWR